MISSGKSSLFVSVCRCSTGKSYFLFHTVFGRDLEKDVMSETSGHFKKFMNLMLSVSLYTNSSGHSACTKMM